MGLLNIVSITPEMVALICTVSGRSLELWEPSWAFQCSLNLQEAD